MQRTKPPCLIHIISRTLFFSIFHAKIRFFSTFSLNSTLRSHLNSGNPVLALTHFLESQKQGIKPDKFTIPSLLKLTLQLQEPPLHGQQIHGFSFKSGFLSDPFVGTGLIEYYFKTGHFDSAHRVFGEMPKRDVVLFTAMISGLVQNGFGDRALDCFFEMKEGIIEPTKITLTSVLSACSQLRKLAWGKVLHGFLLRKGFADDADVILQTALLDMYGKCGSAAYAKRVFDRMPERNLVSWNSVIGTFVSNGLFEGGLQLFHDMVFEGWRHPKPSTLASVLSVCGSTTDLWKGKEIHGYVIKCCDSQFAESESLLLSNAIIDMYVKNGVIESAVLVFKNMPTRNVVAWTILISGYGAHGFSRTALDMFTQMKESGINPDGIAFLSIVSACSHGGLVDEGQKLFDSMQIDYNIAPEMTHFVCMVDLYGRAGLLEEAHSFIKAMPVEPSKLVWGALLSSCRTHKKVALGEYAATKAIELDRYDAGNYVLLSRLYAETGRWADLSKVRSLMKELGLRPITAFSWVEVKRKIYKFTVGDRMKESSEDIYDFLESLGIKMERAGLFPDTSNVGHDIDEAQRASDLCGHSEKLALAFALIQCAGQRVIRIGKNLRVCRDCHEAFKFVSSNYDKEIILKDPNRYHRLAKGNCSCCDFW